MISTYGIVNLSCDRNSFMCVSEYAGELFYVNRCIWALAYSFFLLNKKHLGFPLYSNSERK